MQNRHLVAIIAALNTWGALFAGFIGIALAVILTIICVALAVLRWRPMGRMGLMGLMGLSLAACSTTGGPAMPDKVETASYFAGTLHLGKAKTEAAWNEKREKLALLAGVFETANGGLTGESLRTLLRAQFADKPETVALAEFILTFAPPGAVTGGLNNAFLEAVAKGLKSAVGSPPPVWAVK